MWGGIGWESDCGSSRSQSRKDGGRVRPHVAGACQGCKPLPSTSVESRAALMGQLDHSRCRPCNHIAVTNALETAHEPSEKVVSYHDRCRGRDVGRLDKSVAAKAAAPARFSTTTGVMPQPAQNIHNVPKPIALAPMGLRRMHGKGAPRATADISMNPKRRRTAGRVIPEPLAPIPAMAPEAPARTAAMTAPIRSISPPCATFAYLLLDKVSWYRLTCRMRSRSGPLSIDTADSAPAPSGIGSSHSHAIPEYRTHDTNPRIPAIKKMELSEGLQWNKDHGPGIPRDWGGLSCSISQWW
jgi:hypothetical protein